MKTTKILAATLTVTLGLGGGVANADFSGPYDVSKWRSDGVLTDGAPAFITLYHQAVPIGVFGSSSFVTKAVDESNVSFNWNTNVGLIMLGGLRLNLFRTVFTRFWRIQMMVPAQVHFLEMSMQVMNSVFSCAVPNIFHFLSAREFRTSM